MSLATPRKGYKSVPWLFGKEIEIPEEWDVKKCSKILELKHGYQFRDEDFIQGKKGIKIIKIGNLKKNGSIDSNNCDIISLDRKSDFLNIVINSGDVLMALTGATLGKIIQVPKINEVLLQNYRVGNFFPKKDIDKNFLYCVLKNIFTQKQIWFLVNSGAQPNIGKEDFDKIKIICPPLPEQQKIANILSNVDDLIESTGKVITHSKKVKTGLMQKLLTRGIGHTKFKKVPWVFGKEIEIPEEWEVKKVGSISKIKGGKRLPKGEPFSKDKTNHPYLRVTDFGTNTIYEKNLEYVTDGIFKKIKNYTISSENVYISIAGTIGLAGLIPKSLDGASLTENACKIIVTKQIIKEYLSIILNSKPIQDQIKSYLGITSQPKLALFRIEKLQFPLPPLPEQQKIASILSNVDDKITSQEQYKEKLEKLKKSLMQKLLTGEVRV